MNWKITLIIIASFIFFFSCEKDNSETDAENFKEEVLLEVNKLRASGCTCGSDNMSAVPDLEWNDKLEIAAKRHSKDMNDNSHFSHTGTDGSKFSERITDAGYVWTACAENIAKGQDDVKAVILSWKNSEGHCKNMMNGTYTHIAVVKNGDYWTMELGTGN